jgi:two-component system cell cycle sensor histidine kinase/response regulator CckA
MGMSPHVAARAVEPFFTTKMPGKGTGLGLAMVHGAVKAHGGTLEISSTPGQGTMVTIAFPKPAEAGSDAPGSWRPPTSKREPLRILLVDDDELIRAGVSALLEMEGHDVHLSDGGMAAIEKLRDGLEPDLVILDVNMPGLTGPQTLEEILAVRPNQRVLMASGFGDEAMARAAEGRPNVFAIQKPFTLDDLEAKLDAVRST